ncbi:MAG: metalloendopeptidase [Bdellovibrionaceae bacterium]|nr:metalloendopeptidase [Pseudobdellovibrionaceae bacterium]MBC7457010.1 metalloendopeptidase [Pseudobdellovibrionaceae bacterium]
MLGSNNDKNDPLEEFEFRPINEGLGFHRKNKSSQATSSSSTSFQLSTPTTSSTSNSNASLNNPKLSTRSMQGSASASSAGTLSSSPFQTTLPRNEMKKEIATNKKATSFQVPTIEDDSIAKAQTAVNEILKNLNQKRQLDFVSETEKQKVQLKKSKPQLFAIVLDGMLVMAAFLMSLILMLSITKIDMILNLTHPETSGMVYLATAALFAMVTFVYMAVNRAILGYTPGEWAFDQQCGQNEENESVMFMLKIAFRTVVVMATGFVVMPFLSYLFNKDMAGDITGAQLYRKPTGL